MELSWSALKRPKVLLTIAEVFLAIIGVIMLLVYQGVAKLEPKTSHPSSQSWYGLRVKLSYPFNTAKSEAWTPDDPAPQTGPTITFPGGVKTSSEFLLVVFVLSAVLACVRLLLYALLKDQILRQRFPPVEVFATGVTAVMILVAPSLFVHHVKSDMSSEVEKELTAVYPVCAQTWPSGCVIKNSSSVYGLLYASSAMGFVLTILWAVSCWYAYRNTYLHRPYYVQHQEAGTGPGARHVAANVSDGPVEGVELQSVQTVRRASDFSYGTGNTAAVALSY